MDKKKDISRLKEATYWCELANAILYDVENIENATGQKPTIFMTIDMIAILTAWENMEFRCDHIADGRIIFAGYDVERISGENKIYVGYKVSVPLR